jgi:hypothetical protein
MYTNSNSFNQANNFTNNNPNSCFTTQTLLNKQKVSLLKDQHASNMIMCRILSELENLVIFFSYPGKKYFGYYATLQKNYQDIINQIIFQLKIFESSFQDFIKNNREGQQYKFPNNLDYKEIVRIVNDWKKYLGNKAIETNNSICSSVIRYYDEFLNILNKGKISGFFQTEYENFGKNSPPITKNELKRVMNAGATATCFMNEQFTKIEDEVAKKGDYKVNVVLNRDRKDNPFYNRVGDYDKNLNNCMNTTINLLNMMLAYLERFAIISLPPFSQIHIQPVYSTKIGINYNDKNKIYQEYMKYLDKFYDFYNSNENVYDLDERDLNKIINDIKSWKNKVTDFYVKNELENAIKYIQNVKSQDLGAKSNM